jgi:hypothetical protein
MIELKIKGNKESYQLTKKVDYIDISLGGNFDFNSNSRINFQYDNYNLTFENRNRLFKFAEEIRGTSLDKLILTFSKYEFESSFINNLANKKSTEIGLLKAIFLIYYWIDLPLTNPTDLDLEKQLFNEFVVDWTNQPEPQKDIYFIDKRHITPDNRPYIQKLIDLNLLASFKVQIHDKETISTYFIPLVKPGVSRENFMTEFDTKGDKTYSFWKGILKDRDIRITNWINNRF